MSVVYLNHQAVRANTVYCVGRNYAEHIAELGNEKPKQPLVFLKPNSSILANGGKIVLPAFSDDVHYETELVLLIGEDVDDLLPEAAWQIIAGFAVGLDLTARDIQADVKAKGLPWTQAKGFKTAACVSNFVAAKQFAATMPITFSMVLNKQLRQQGNSEQMIFPIVDLLCYLATHYGLRAGDLVFTGTPKGVGKLHCGDELLLDLAGVQQAKFFVA